MRKRILIFLAAALVIFSIVIASRADTDIQTARVAYITIDDGPTLNTPRFLEILDKYNAKATFFVLRERIIAYPEYIRAMHYASHSIALHGTSHSAKAVYATPTSPLEEMESANEALYDLMGMRSSLCRTPYGSNPYMSKKQAELLIGAGYKIWDWNVDPRDGIGKSVPRETIMANLRRGIAKVQGDAVILLHDRKSTLNAFEDVVRYLTECGFECRAIDEAQSPLNAVDKLK